MTVRHYQRRGTAALLVTKPARTETEVLLTCLCGCGEQFLCPARLTARRMYVNHTHAQRAYRARLELRGPKAHKQYQLLPAGELAAR